MEHFTGLRQVTVNRTLWGLTDAWLSRTDRIRNQFLRAPLLYDGIVDDFAEAQVLTSEEMAKLDDEYALALGRVIIEAARLEHSVAELCWTLMGYPNVDDARIATEKWQFHQLKKETEKLAKRRLETSGANQVIAALEEARPHIEQRGSLAHLVIYRSGPHRLGFRRFQEVRAIDLETLVGELAQHAAKISILHGDVARHLGVLPR